MSADTPPMNSAVIEKLALPFPILSDPDRDQAVTPLGFADVKDPRLISRAAAVVVDPGGEIAFSYTGRDFADRPHEDLLLEEVAKLELGPTTQEPPVTGAAEPGSAAMPFEGLPYYFKGAKFAVLALRSRHRDNGAEFRDDGKRYVQMIERYIEALPDVEERRS